MNKKIFVRKNKDNDEYIAYGYIRTFDGRIGMIWFSGLTFSEAINKLLNY